MATFTGKKTAIFFAKVGATVLVAAGLAQLTWYALDRFSILPAAPAPAPTPAPVAQNHPAPSPPPSTPVNNPPRAPRVNADLVLTGIVKTGNSGGVAVMRVNNQPETAFVVGQQILPSIVLHAVMANRILIMNDGVLESLTLSGKRTQLTLAESETAAPSLDGIGTLAENHYSIPRKLIETNVINPQALLNEPTIVPTAEGGLTIQSVAAGSVYEKLGVRSGDIVRTANERPLSTVQDAMQIYYELQAHGGTGDIRLEILRKGEVLYLQYTIQ